MRGDRFSALWTPGLRPETEPADGSVTRVSVDRLRAVDRELRSGEFAGRLDAHEPDQVDTSCRMILGML